MHIAHTYTDTHTHIYTLHIIHTHTVHTHIIHTKHTYSIIHTYTLTHTHNGRKSRRNKMESNNRQYREYEPDRTL